MQKYSMDKWAGIGAGAGFAIGLLRELFYQATTQIFSITELLLMSAGVAFLGGVVGAVLFGVFSVTIDLAARSNSSFKKGMIYVLIPLTVGTAADLVLLRGLQTKQRSSVPNYLTTDMVHTTRVMIGSLRRKDHIVMPTNRQRS